MFVQASIQEVLGSSDGESALQMMTKDQYANYVVQKMLEVSTCWHAVLCCAVISHVVLACCAVSWSHLLCQHAVLWCHSLCQHAVLWCTWLSQHAVLCCHSLCRHAGGQYITLQNVSWSDCICILQSCSICLTVSVCSHLQTCSVLVVSVYSQHRVKHSMVCLIAHWNNCLNGNLMSVWSFCYNGSSLHGQ